VREKQSRKGQRSAGRRSRRSSKRPRPAREKELGEIRDEKGEEKIAAAQKEVKPTEGSGGGCGLRQACG